VKSIIALIVTCLIAMSANAEENKKLIWNNIPFVKAGNYLEFNAELSRTRTEARAELMGELASLLVPMAYSTDDVVRMAQVLANTLVRFDGLVRQHAQEVHQGIPASLTDDFKAGLTQRMTDNRLNDNEQRTGLAQLARDDLQEISSRRIPLEEARRLMHDLRYLAYGSYTVTGRGVVRAALTLEDLLTSRAMSVTAQGPISEVGDLLASEVFNLLQRNEYSNWENPQPQLTWVAPAFPQKTVNADLAKQYCRSQKARLPFAEELLQAAMAGPYRKGGIGPLINSAFYIVADKNRFDEQYYYNTDDNAQTHTGGPLHTAAGHGTITGYYWCVRGEPSKETLFNQAVYRQIRQNLRRDRDDVVYALEYVLANTKDLDPELLARHAGKKRRETPFHSLDGAIQFLAKNEVFLQLP
jgi:hypothetical protein